MSELVVRLFILIGLLAWRNCQNSLRLLLTLLVRWVFVYVPQLILRALVTVYVNIRPGRQHRATHLQSAAVIVVRELLKDISLALAIRRASHLNGRVECLECTVSGVTV